MKITILELDEAHTGQVNACDGAFEVRARLRLRLERGRLAYTLEAIAPYEKRYPPEAIDPRDDLNRSDRAIYLAYAEGQIAGQLILRTNWNRYAYIEDIRVDAAYRRQGIGRRLVETAVGWARAKGLPGVMLETQDTNVAACRLYEGCGFVLGGFDTYLYRGLQPGTDEVALYWYYLFQNDPRSGTPPAASHAGGGGERGRPAASPPVEIAV